MSLRFKSVSCIAKEIVLAIVILPYTPIQICVLTTEVTVFLLHQINQRCRTRIEHDFQIMLDGVWPLLRQTGFRWVFTCPSLLDWELASSSLSVNISYRGYKSYDQIQLRYCITARHCA